ncbi:class II glutamine amidotransferase [Marinobacterium aestuariivivens]|uniref:Class II glutamine amidotransferase n=1 Tax=Marinobacterium aestuariivivens TaxID=1698799 RepID=A0ABW1ZT41_9GAMM
MLFALSRAEAGPLEPEHLLPGAEAAAPPAQGLGCYEGADALLIRGPAAGGLIEHFVSGFGRPCALLLSCSGPAERLPLADSQPFARELHGHTHLFAFQGQLQGLEDSRKYPTGPYRPVGATVAEQAFCVLMARMRALWQDGKPLPEVRLALVTDFAARMRPLGLANFIYSDSELLFAHAQHRPDDPAAPGLFVSERPGRPASPRWRRARAGRRWRRERS